jgi:hypothetical protein
VKGTFRLPTNPPVGPRAQAPAETEEAQRFFDRPCYEFNRQLEPDWNDRYCEHCRYYLTARCPHIDEFLDDVEDLTPE